MVLGHFVVLGSRKMIYCCWVPHIVVVRLLTRNAFVKEMYKSCASCVYTRTHARIYVCTLPIFWLWSVLTWKAFEEEMYICLHIMRLYTHTHTHTCINIYICIYMYICINMYATLAFRDWINGFRIPEISLYKLHPQVIRSLWSVL